MPERVQASLTQRGDLLTGDGPGLEKPG